MKIKSSDHEITAVKPDQYPVTGFPEIAFVGRSNVGKSSIINTLLNRKSLARVGSTPGKTRQINFYNINEEFYLVDLPGYGFASVSKDMKASWHQIIETYLYARKNIHLKAVILLVDIRHSPSKDDVIMYQWLKGYGLDTIIIATKADKITKSQINVRINDIKKVLGVDKDTKVVPFSSFNRYGLEDAWKEIELKLYSEDLGEDVIEDADNKATGNIENDVIEK